MVGLRIQLAESLRNMEAKIGHYFDEAERSLLAVTQEYISSVPALPGADTDECEPEPRLSSQLRQYMASR